MLKTVPIFLGARVTLARCNRTGLITRNSGDSHPHSRSGSRRWLAAMELCLCQLRRRARWKIAPQAQSSIAITGRLRGVHAGSDYIPDLPRRSKARGHCNPGRPADAGPRNSRSQESYDKRRTSDHCVGLLLLRKQERQWCVYAADETQKALGWIHGILGAIMRIEWRKISDDFQS